MGLVMFSWLALSSSGQDLYRVAGVWAGPVPHKFARDSYAWVAYRSPSYWVDGKVFPVQVNGFDQLIYPAGISTDGSVVVGSVSAIGGEWTEGLVLTGGLTYPGPFDLQYEGVSGDGTLAVGKLGPRSGPNRAFKQVLDRPSYFPPQMLPTLAGGDGSSEAVDLTADAAVIVGVCTNAEGVEAVIWKEDTVVALGDLPGGSHYSSAEAVSADGLTVVGTSSSTRSIEAFVWRDGVMRGLGGLSDGPPNSAAYGVSGDGRIIVGRSAPTGTSDRPVVWIADRGPFHLEEVMIASGLAAKMEDWRGFTVGRAISDDGKRIAFTGTLAGVGIPFVVGIFELPPAHSRVAGAKLPSRLSNLSVRSHLEVGQTLTVGLVIDQGLKPVLFRAAGPALTALDVGLTGVDEPYCRFHRIDSTGSSLIAEGGYRYTHLAPLSEELGAFPFAWGSADAARQLAVAGPTTMQVISDTPGAVLVEAYDAELEGGGQFSNMSVRHRVGAGNDALVAGFVVRGADAVSLLIRGVGPTLTANYGIQGTLEKPRIEIYNADQQLIDFSEDWESTTRGASAETTSRLGAFPLEEGLGDAAREVTLPGNSLYTVRLVGADGGTGEGLLEIYQIVD